MMNLPEGFSIRAAAAPAQKCGPAPKVIAGPVSRGEGLAGDRQRVVGRFFQRQFELGVGCHVIQVTPVVIITFREVKLR